MQEFEDDGVCACVCVYVCALPGCIYMFVRVQLYVSLPDMHQARGLTSGVVPQELSLFFEIESLNRTWGFASLHLPSLEALTTNPGFLCGFRRFNSGPHT